VDDDSSWYSDVFVHDRQTGTTERVSVSSTGEQANNHSEYFRSGRFYGRPAISADGRFVSFASDASNLVDGDTGGETDIFVHDRQTGETMRVSVSSSGEQGNHWSLQSSISADGRHVAFYSRASNLVPEDGGEGLDVFVYDRQTGTMERVSHCGCGEEVSDGNGLSEGPAISADGRFVAFTSWATNLVPNLGDTNRAYDVFVYSRDGEDADEEKIYLPLLLRN
jgi:Tol biopolymer transport system component